MSGSADPDVSMPAPDIEPLFSTVTPVLFPEQEGHATGFFFVDDADDRYLITNHHVVTDDGGSPAADSVRILTRPSTEIDDLDFHEVPLRRDGEPTWVEHPRGPDIDVVAVPLPFDPGPIQTVALHSGLFPAAGEMPVTQGATVVGYPLLEHAPFLPLLRTAAIASPYGTTYRELPCFVTDADLHSGMSGSPVFTLPESASRRGDMLGGELNLVGVHSATLFSGHPPQEGSLDLNIAWYIQLLADMVEIDR